MGPFLLITGMHRSGTSFLARALNLSGADLGNFEQLISDDWRPQSDNKRGLWENKEILDLGNRTLSLNHGSWDEPPKNIVLDTEIKKEVRNEFNKIFYRPSLAAGYKDPRLILYFDAWRELFPKNVIVIGIFRHPLYVAESLKRRDNFGYEKSINLWKTYNQKLLEILEKENGFLLNFDWPKERLFSEVKFISNKLGLIDVDLSDWYTSDIISSNKKYNSEFQLSEDITNLYTRLNERCEINKNQNPITFHRSESELNEIIKGVLLELKNQGAHFKKINDGNLEQLKKIDKHCKLLETKYKELKTEYIEVKDLLETEHNQIKNLLEQERKENSETQDQLEQEKSKSEGLEYQLNITKQELENITQSPGWKFVLSFMKKFDYYLPIATQRREFAKNFMFKLMSYSEKDASKSYTDTSYQFRPPSAEYLKWKKNTSVINSVKKKKVGPHPQISIIITVHDNSNVAIPCIESVLKWTSKPYHLVIVDDKSTEAKLLGYFRKLSKFDDVIIIKNNENLGYVKSVNNAIKNSEDDVILLNSDTIVTKNWLDKIHACAYSNDKIATVSPLSNNATICSVPEFGVPNKIPSGLTIDQFAEVVEKSSKFCYEPIPTCVGFCMYVKRAVINEIGLFNEKFSPAYGEEDDFCMRAYKKGFFSVIDDSTFVFHHGESSYKESTERLKEKHMEVLLESHPKFLDIIDGFFSENPIKEIHYNIKNSLSRRTRLKAKNVLMVLHQPVYAQNPGGTEMITRTLYEKIPNFSKYLFYSINDSFVFEENTKFGRRILYRFKKSETNEGMIQCSPEAAEFFSNVLDELDIGLIHFQHALSLPLNFFHIAKDKGIKTILSCNDFYFICPRINLLENGSLNAFCNACQDMKRCDRCLKKIGYPEGFQRNWRKECQQIFKIVDLVITPTKSVLDIYKKTYDIEQNRTMIIEHGFTPQLKNKINVPTFSKNFKIGFIGAVMIPHKGKDLILDIITANKNVNIEWHFFGNNSDPSPYIKSKQKIVGKIVTHGRYENEKLPTMLHEEGINLVVIPSIESYSMVLSEVWTAKIPVVGPNIMSLGERINKKEAGWTYEYPGSAEEILDIIFNLMKNPSEYHKKLEKFDNLKLKEEAEFVKDYTEVYEALILQ